MSENKAGRRARKPEKRVAESEELNHSLTKIAKGAGIVFFGMMIGKIIGYFYTMLAARLGTEQFGLLNLGFSIVSLIVTLSLLGLDNGVLRYIAYYQGKKDKARVKGAIVSALKICGSLSIFLALIVLFFSPQIAVSIFHNSKLAPVLRIFSIMIPFAAIGTIFLASFRAFQRVDYQVGLNEIAEKAARLLATFLLVSLGFGVIGAAYSYLISAAIVFILAVLILEKKVFPVFRTKVRARYYPKELLFYSIPLLLTGVLVFVIVWLDTIMLGYFRTAVEVGVYSAAHPTAALMFVLPTALISLFLPIITGLYSQKKHEKIKKIYKTVSRWIFFVNFPIFLLMVAFSRQITGIIFGQEYVAGATALAILVFGYLVYSVAYPSNALLQMAKKTRFLFFSTLIFASSNLLLNYLLIPKYGVNGAAIAASVSYLIGSLINISFSSKLMQTSPLDKTFFKSSLAGVVAILLTYNATKLLFKPASIYTLAIMFALFLLLYLGLLFLFRSFEKDDQIMFRVILSKLRIYYK